MKKKKVLFRKCVGCNTMKDKKTLLRIVKNKNGNFLLDNTNKQPGRGAYICKDKSCIEKTIKHKGLERSFKSNIPSFIYESLKEKIIE